MPLYFQVEQALATQIRRRAIPAGARLPTEPELSDYFGVSRSVIRQAPSALQANSASRRCSPIWLKVVRTSVSSRRIVRHHGVTAALVHRLAHGRAMDAIPAHLNAAYARRRAIHRTYDTAFSIG